ncbi:D-alanyl-D-alanine carboxypeptidase [Rhizobium puerariae]|uniref:D-alanyl-D-alanine carboxypeptidase n=1 Tax=Rhizobium puerariae TaxID=1585791 RepID=A0ABV6AEN1_9HYPH
MFRIQRVLAFLFLAGAFLAMGRTAEAGYAHFIYDARSGKVLASENADDINHPASLTKMMTLYMTFEALRDGRLGWNQEIVMTLNAASKIPFKLGVPAGQTFTVREAVFAMAVRSANDAAAAMADHLGGSEERFGQMMTKKARSLGMTRTVFRNASGLPDDQQVTTARDMAMLALALIRDFPKEYQLFSLRSFEFRGRKIPGHNNLMYRYPGMDGVKTGYIRASGFNIASAVNVNGRRVIGVVLGGKTARQRDDRMAELLDQSVPGNVPAAGGLVAFEAQQKRPGEGAVPLPFAVPRKEITLGNPAGNPPARASIANLYATPQEPVGPLWRIQIAAAGSREAASGMLQKALPLLAENFGRIAPSVESYADGRKEYFRARFVGFSDAAAAAQACSVLQSKSINCFVVQ